MITIITFCLLIIIFKITFKALPAIIGISLALSFTLFQVVGFILLLPALGILFIVLDVCVLGMIVCILKIIMKD